MYYYISNIDNCCFWVVAELANVEFIVECLSEIDYEKATEIANREIGYWCSPEESPDEEKYRNAGYVEVVKDALDDERIATKIYTLYEND